MPPRDPKGDVIVVSAPSGAGKTTLLKGLLRRIRDLEFSVSYTTRTPRRGERDGIDYHFVPEKLFRRMIRRREFLEWAEVYGHLYGTRRKEIERFRRRGKDVLLDLDTQGAAKIRRRVPGAVFIFILPPGPKALGRRLRGRGLDSDGTLRRRLAKAAGEIRHFPRYDYLVVNDQVVNALRQLEAVVLSGRCRLARVRRKARRILEAF